MVQNTTNTNHYFLKALVMLAALAVAVSSLVQEARPAHAAFPGANGRIVFDTNRDGNEEIYAMNPNGTNQVNLTKYPSANDFDPAVSPDGTKIAFTSTRAGDPDIWVMNADGSNQQHLTTSTASDTDPSWSPDGKQIVFVSDRTGNPDIWVMNASDGSILDNLTADPWGAISLPFTRPAVTRSPS